MKKIALLSAILAHSLINVQGSDFIAFSHKNNGTNTIVIPEKEVWQLITYTAVNTYFEIFSSTNQTQEDLIGFLDGDDDSILNPTAHINEKNGCINITLIGPAYVYNKAIETIPHKYYLVLKSSKIVALSLLLRW